MNQREDGRTKIKELVKKYENNYLDLTNSIEVYNEANLRVDFLDPFLEALGWDVRNTKQVPQYVREIICEDTVRVEDHKKRPDYAFRLGQKRKFFLEAKKPIVSIISSSRPAFQLRRYGWSAGMPISILSNFDRLIIYDCTQKPDPSENADICRIGSYSYQEYEDKFDEIYDLFSREAVYSGVFDKKFAVENLNRGNEPFDQYFLSQVERWRNVLAKDLVDNNPFLEQAQINLLVQKLIDRIIFLRACEDREIENPDSLKSIKTYSELKEIFKNADIRYNSGLFNFTEDNLSLAVNLGNDIIIQVLSELYYPESPYTFSVIETEVISAIYELFLSKAIHLRKDGSIEIINKPEIIDSNGVVPTPKDIVDAIVQKTLDPLCKDKTPEELFDLKIADIACGSGSFLLSAYEYLKNYYLEWYINDGPDKHGQKIYQGDKGNWFLQLFEKRRILSNNIYGVDIDQQAVEVTQFSLLLKVLEEETSNAISSLHRRYSLKALPDLAKNIRCGNSLVDKNYDVFNGSTSHNLAEVKSLDWNETFPDIMKNGGFNAIIGNPPYIRIQNMVTYSPNEVAYFKSKESYYVSSKHKNFDKYSLFIEKGIHLLKSGGRLGYIVPHKFFYIKSGKELRQLISSNNHLSEIVHFGVQQVFQGQTTTYTCILILEKKPSEFVIVEHVNDIGEWLRNHSNNINKLPSNTFNDNPWILVPSKAQKIFDHLSKQNPKTLGATSKIFVGIQTSADKVYVLRKIIEVTEDYVTFIDSSKKTWTIEKAIIRPCIYKAYVPAFGTPSPNAYIIFPYDISDERYEQKEIPVIGRNSKEKASKRTTNQLYSKEEMEEKFPRCWEYLKAHKVDLDARKSVHGRKETSWYRYGRQQNHGEFDGKPKLVWYTLSLSARYAYDTTNFIFTGGGNGPYYGLKELPNSSLSLYYFLAILSHPLFDIMVQVRASQFSGKYLSYGKQFIEGIPIHMINPEDSYEVALYDKIVLQTQELIGVTQKKLEALSIGEKEELEIKAKSIKEEIDSLINSLYGISTEDIELIKDLEKVGEVLETETASDAEMEEE